MTNFEYVKLQGYAYLDAKLSNGKTETVKTYVTLWGYECSEDAEIIGMSPRRWFESDDDTVEVCYPDEFEIFDSEAGLVEPEEDVIITEIVNVIRLEDDMSVIDTWEDEVERD